MLSVVIIIVTALIFSAFFSGMEIAFLSSNKLRLEIEKKQGKTYNYIIDVFLRNTGQYAAAMLTGRNIALVIYAISMSLLLNSIATGLGFRAGTGSVILEIVVSTAVIIFAAELLLKAAFRNNPNFMLRIFSVPVYIIYLILYPVARLVIWLPIAFLRMFGIKARSGHAIKNIDRVDLTHLLEKVKENEQEAGNSENEIKLFRNALDFPDLLVRDCMVPRVDIEAVDILDTIEHLSERFIETNYSRILVYDGSVDNIIGYVTTKSLFNSPQSVREILMDVEYVPETFSAQKLLSMFIKNKQAIAVVIDEFGGTAGMVSMEDVLEEIFGEIEDEHDEQDMVEKVTADGAYILSCRLEVEYLNGKYGLGIPESDEYDTLAGFIIYYHEGIPSQGEELTIGDKEIRILGMNGSKLELARVRLLTRE